MIIFNNPFVESHQNGSLKAKPFGLENRDLNLNGTRERFMSFVTFDGCVTYFGFLEAIIEMS